MDIIKTRRFTIQGTLLSAAIAVVTAQDDAIENYNIITNLINVVTLILICFLLIFLIYIIWFKKRSEYNTLNEVNDSVSKK